MGKVTILEETTKDPITKMGRSCGLCWGSKTSDPVLNYKRGKKVMLSDHGRVEEFANVEMVLEGYSARVIREWYTHIVGARHQQDILITQKTVDSNMLRRHLSQDAHRRWKSIRIS